MLQDQRLRYCVHFINHLLQLFSTAHTLDLKCSLSKYLKEYSHYISFIYNQLFIEHFIKAYGALNITLNGLINLFTSRRNRNLRTFLLPLHDSSECLFPLIPPPRSQLVLLLLLSLITYPRFLPTECSTIDF
jgi:hypothetical protein